MLQLCSDQFEASTYSLRYPPPLPFKILKIGSFKFLPPPLPSPGPKLYSNTSPKCGFDLPFSRITEPKLYKQAQSGAAENAKISPPELSFKIPEISELPEIFSDWENNKLPIDIVLFAVKDDEFLSCFAYLKEPIVTSYNKITGRVYFSSMEDDRGHKIEIALMRCSKVHDGPGGALSAAKRAISLLRPKALFSVGACRSLKSTKVKLGDVVVSSKLITPDFQIPPRKYLGDLIGNIADGWKAPLRNANDYKPKVHSGPLLSISKANKDIISDHRDAIAVEKNGGGENHNKKDEPGTSLQCIIFSFLFEHVACGE